MDPNNSLIKMSYDINNRVTFDQIHNNLNETKFYIEKLLSLERRFNIEVFSVTSLFDTTSSERIF